MATSSVMKFSAFKAESNNGNSIASKANRMIGTRTVLPGTYVFDNDPQVKISEFQITGRQEPLYSMEVKSQDGRWINIDSLCKKTVREGQFGYVNAFAAEHQDTASLAEALCGSTLNVSNEAVDVYSTYYSENGEPAASHPTAPRRNNQKAYVATLVKTAPKA